MEKTMLKIFSFILILLSLNCYSKEPVFSFSIFSDNTGDGAERVEFSRMVDWIAAEGHPFVLGMGDHVKKSTKNKFIDFIEGNEWWQKNFYPTIADNDNEFFGKNQADWGAGKALFDLTDIKKRPDVQFRENWAEYYAKIEHKGINIHFISLHYPDMPKNDSVSFREDSKEFMVETLKNISKTGKDIIIIGAHSRLGYWIDKLNGEQKKIVNEKADLVLSATTHVFHIGSGNGDSGPLVLNTGSITRPRLWGSAGFVSIEVLDEPLRIEVSYIDCSKEKPSKPVMFFRAKKIIGGRIERF
jgi:hypothetical protein